MKKTVYLETTVVSYLTAKPSRDLIVAAHQQITREWWETASLRFDLYTSVVTLDEVAQGDVEAAGRRLAAVEDMALLHRTEEADELAAHYARKLTIPDKALADCYHLALACWHGMDYLVSWNLHFARNKPMRR